MVDWPKKDLINWVEWRFRAFEVSRENARKGIPPEEPDHPLTELDFKMWLAKERDEQSLSEIAQQQYPREWRKGKGKRKNQTPISRARRSIARVERFLNRGAAGFAYPKKMRDALNASIKDLFNRAPW
jgi:hypothetical protein